MKKHTHKWDVMEIEYGCKICHKKSKLIDIIREDLEPNTSTISDVIYNKKGTIIGFKNERPMKLARGL